ncbi:MAG: hypothetical protein H6564_12255 [Lewinellaceae bacterium]|nr:hypothetical protein [Lewinellaceae bacterium]
MALVDQTNIRKELRRLVAADELEQAIQQLLSFTEATEVDDLHKEVILQSGRLEDYRKGLRSGGLDYKDLARTKVNISQAILEITDKLPELREDGTVVKEKRRGIREKVLRTHILWLMFGIKGLIVLFVLTLWQSGGFTAAQFMVTLALLLPIFATYTTVMVRSSIRERYIQQYATTALEPRVSRNFQFTTYGVLLIYGFALFYVIDLRGRGVLGQFDYMTSLLALVELLLGVYVGQLVFSLFKKEE